MKLKDVVASAGDSMTQDEILLRVLGQKSGHVHGKGTRVRAYSKDKAQIEQRKIVEQQQEKFKSNNNKLKILWKVSCYNNENLKNIRHNNKKQLNR